MLTEFARALQREAMYPDNHPALEGSAAQVREAVTEALGDGEDITVHVARRQLDVDGALTDPENPVLSSLASQLHRHQIAALSLGRGLGTQEVSELLGALTAEPERGREPLSDRGWRHIRVTFFPYEQLGLDSGEHSDLPTGELANVWLAFAQAALDEEAIDLEDTMDTGRIAGRISKLCSADKYCRQVTGRFLAVEQAIARNPSESASLSALASDVVAKLNPEALKGLLKQGGGAAERRELLSSAANSLRVDAVLKLLLQASEFETRETPPAVWLVFSKLARQAEHGAAGERQQASGHLRDQVTELLAAWEGDQFTPSDYRQELSAITGMDGRGLDRISGGSRTAVQPKRVLQMAVETRQPGEAVRQAFDRMVRDGALGIALDVLEEADTDNPAARQLRDLAAAEETLDLLLPEEAPDFELIDRLVRLIGVHAAPSLLDAIAEGESRANRGRIFRRLVRLGPGIGPEIVRRLDDERWYVRRNLLALLDDIGSIPPGFLAGEYLDDPHEAVRRAAIKLALQQPEGREKAIQAALSSADPRAVMLGLVAARSGAPPRLVDRIAELAVDDENSPEIRMHATRALSGARTEVAMEALLRIARGPRRWVFGVRSSRPTPLELEALAVLGSTWPEDPRAKKLLSRRRREAEPSTRTP